MIKAALELFRKNNIDFRKNNGTPYPAWRMRRDLAIIL